VRKPLRTIEGNPVEPIIDRRDHRTVLDRIVGRGGAEDVPDYEAQHRAPTRRFTEILRARIQGPVSSASASAPC